MLWFVCTDHGKLGTFEIQFLGFNRSWIRFRKFMAKLTVLTVCSFGHLSSFLFWSGKKVASVPGICSAYGQSYALFVSILSSVLCVFNNKVQNAILTSLVSSWANKFCSVHWLDLCSVVVTLPRFVNCQLCSLCVVEPCFGSLTLWTGLRI